MEQRDNLQLHDKQMVELVLAGQTQAYGHLVQRYWKLALAVAYSQCQNTAAAEDIAQNSFIKAYQHLPSLRNRAQFAGWLTKIIRQECIDHHRSRQNTIPLDSQTIDRLPSTFVIASNPGLTPEQIERVHQAIGKLPDHLQDIIIMRFVAGLPLREIAQQIGKRYGTVRVWLHRAYKQLKEELAPTLREVQS